MQKIPDSGTNSTTKCTDTTEESIQSTLEETTKRRGKGGKQTQSRHRGSDTSGSREKSEGPPPRILANELSQWTYLHGETRYQADDTEHMFAWLAFVSEWANVKKPLDWEDLEERSHFLNMLYVWCEKQSMPFPLEKTLNFSENKSASEAN